MERAFDVSPPPAIEPPSSLVVSLFQRREYFDREAARYSAFAERGCTVIVGFVGPVDDLPAGVNPVSFADDEPLSEEWSLVLLAGTYGSALVAYDDHQLATDELTMQAGRLFSAHWTFHREKAIGEANRILSALAARLPPAVTARAQADIDASARVPVSSAEAQLSVAADHLITALDAGHRRAVRTRVELDQVRALAEQDQLTGLRNRHFLERFLGNGHTDNPADLGVLLVDVDNLKAANDRFGHLAGDAVITAVARTLQATTRPGDVVVRWGGDEFLVLASSLSAAEALQMAERLANAVRGSRADPPWEELALSVSIGVARTARTALPLDALDSALYSVKRTAKGHAALAVQPGL